MRARVAPLGLGPLLAVVALLSLWLVPHAVLGECTGSDFGDPECTLYIADLDRGDFLRAFLMFGIPCLVCVLLGGWAFHRAQYKARLLPSVVSSWRVFNLSTDDKRLEKALAWIVLGVLFVAVLPSVFILLWGIWVYVKVNHLLGFSLFLVLMALQMILYSFAHWNRNGWRVDRLVVVLFVLALLCCWSFEIWTIFSREPYTYFNLSVVFVCFNYLPCLLLTYLVSRSRTKPLEQYALLGNHPVDDYRKFQQEMALQQERPKVGATEDHHPLAGDVAISSFSRGPAQQEERKHDEEEKKEQRIVVQPAPAAGAATGTSGVQGAPSGPMSSRALLQAMSSSLRQRSTLQQLACAVVALLILLFYSLAVALIKDTDGFGNVVGWITSGTILALDGCIWLSAYGGRISTPLEAALYQLACRIIIVMTGDVYWFLGHSVLYVVLAVFFGFSMLDTLLPKLSPKAQRSNAVDSILAAPTVVVVDPVPDAAAGVLPAAPPVAPTAAAASSDSADRYSTQLGAGFIEAGWFGSTRLGQSLLHYISFWSFGFLTVAFIVDLSVNSATSTVPQHLSKDHDQYLAGVLALFLTGVILSTLALARMYYNRDYRIDMRILIACAAQWVVCVGCGVFLLEMTDSVILICLFCYGPPIVYLCAYAYRAWKENDFQIYLAPNDPSKENAVARQRGKSQAAVNKAQKRAQARSLELALANVNSPVPSDANPSVAAPVSPSNDAQGAEEHKIDVAVEPAGKLAGGDAGALPGTPSAPVLEPLDASFRQPRMDNLKEVKINLGQYDSHWAKYRIALTALLAALLTLAMGVTIAALSDPPYVGYSIAASLLILATTALPIIEWFNSFSLSRNMIVQLVASTAMFVAFVLVFWLEGLGAESTNESLALLFLLFLYPSLVVLSFALLKWRDDQWVMGRFVKTALVLCCALIFAFFIAVAAVYEPWQIGVALIVGFLVLLFGSFLVPVVLARWPHLLKWFLGAGLAVLIAFAAGVGSQDGYGFIGFSLAWGILFACLAVSAFQAHANTSKTGAPVSHLASPNLFPIFRYLTQPGARNPLERDDKRVYLVYAALLVAMLWAVLAVFFVQRAWIGLGVHALAIVLGALYAAEAVTRPRILLARAVRYLGEGSPLYADAVHRAKLAAFRSQLSSIKSTSQSADQQLASPTASPEPSRALDRSGWPASASGDEESKVGDIDRQVTLAHEAAVSADADALLLEEADLAVLGLGLAGVSSPRASVVAAAPSGEERKQLTELDWDVLYKVFVELRRAVPLPRLKAVFQGDAVEVTMVPWRGVQLPRRRAHELLLKLDHHIAILFGNHLAYLTQLTLEIILAADALKNEHEQEILTMLRDVGQGNLTVDYLRSLKPNDPARRALEEALLAWKAKQEQIRLDRIRKRKEEDERQRQREEEERQRVRAEEERIIRARQEQHAADEAAAIRKQEQLRLRDQQEAAEREEQRLREEAAAQLERDRVAREQADAQRRKEQEALAAQLAGEQNERALRELREQQEAQRVQEELRKEKERQQLEQLAAEQKKREEALAVEAALQAKVQAAIRKRCCTLNETGETFVVQQWYQCLTCSNPNKQTTTGICVVCKDICHAGHKLKDMGRSPFYCDDGLTGCEAATGVKPGLKGKPTLQSILQHYERTGEQWVDPDFQPGVSSLLRNPDAPNSPHADWKKTITWKRPEEMRGMQNPVLYETGADPMDIAQGQLGDCWFLSAMSVMTQRERDFVNMFVTKEHSKAGVYAVNYWKNGERVTVLIDSLFPAIKQGNSHAPVFAHSQQQNELWVMILEKSYAKLHASFEGIEAGHVDCALVDLSGGIGSRIDMSKDPWRQQARNGVLFQQLLDYHRSGFLLGAGSPAGSDSESNASPSGIVQGHAYSLLQIAEVDGHQLLRLRNPWGRKEWTGDWSDKSPLWTRRMKAKLNHTDADDGAFWMSMQDFAIHFDEVYICRFFEDGWIPLPVIKGEWRGATAGGCTNFDSVSANPQYLLTVLEPNTSVVLNLAQTDARGTSGKLKAISIELYQAGGKRVTRTRTGPLECSNPESYIFRREVSIDQQLKPGTYTVLVSTFNSGEETNFTLSIFSTKPITLSEAPPAAKAGARK